MNKGDKMTIDVVYLAYFNKERAYDIKIVKRFLDTYKNYPAGKDHSLVIIAKNLPDEETHKELCELAEQHNARIIDLPDDGFDIGAYFRVSEMLTSEYVLFLASSTQIVFPNWLLKFYNTFEKDESIQLVGAMGSWGDSERKVFPNYHIRTCSFMLKRELFLEYASTQTFPVTKKDTYKMEHGENSLTNFILNKGFNAVVVNSDGDAFSPETWAFSQTFRSPDWKSFFSDGQSIYYAMADEKDKQGLERAVWGQSLKDTKTKIFSSYHKIKPLFESEVYNPIHSGEIDFKKEIRTLRDNTLINIAQKSDYYGELTKHYWVWKNYVPRATAQYIGFNHYKRFLDFNLTKTKTMPFESTFFLDFKYMFEKYTDENISNCINGYDVIVPQKFITEKSLYELYSDSSPKKDMDLALNVLGEIYPEYLDTAKEVLLGKELYACLVFVMKKELINEYMPWMFNILDILEQRTNLEEYAKTSNIKVAVNIAEVFFNIWLQHNIKTKGLKVLETTSVLISSDIDNYLSQCASTIEQSKKK